MLKNDLPLILAFCLLIFLSACAKNGLSNTVAVESEMVLNCCYIDTVSELTDPGKLLFPAKFSHPYDGERKVLQRARDMNASHIVWIYNYPIGSSASAYRCDDRCD